MKLWEGRFGSKGGGLDPAMESFNRSLSFDRRLLAEDIEGSRAYAKALRRAKLLTAPEARKIERALGRLASGNPPVKFLESDEDVHTAVERLLTAAIGAAGKKLHTGRSRNSQVALDTRIYLKKECASIARKLTGVMHALTRLAEKNVETPMPAFTHLQLAQPVRAAHYFLAYVFMLQRDRERFAQCRARLDVMPLGSGAVAGSGFPLDREWLRKELGFAAVSDNSIDAVSDRDFAAEFLSCGAIAAMHLSRFCEDLILFSSPGYGFVELSDKYSTGSSMMPNKKNPDALELIRGKSGRMTGNLVRILTVLKGLPLSYNKDMQEDKEALFDGAGTLNACLTVFEGVVSTLRLRPGNMKRLLKGELMATDLADALVRRGVPFRDAHAVVGRLVRDCAAEGRDPSELSPAALRRYSGRIPGNFRFDVRQSIEARGLYGGTGKKSVRAQLKKVNALLRRPA